MFLGRGGWVNQFFSFGLWCRLSWLAMLDWVPRLCQSKLMTISFKGFGNALKGKALRHIVCLTLICIV